MPPAPASFAQAYVKSLIESAIVSQFPGEIVFTYDKAEMARKDLTNNAVYDKMNLMLPVLLKKAGIMVISVSGVMEQDNKLGCVISIGKNDYEKAQAFAEQVNAKQQQIVPGSYR